MRIKHLSNNLTIYDIYDIYKFPSHNYDFIVLAISFLFNWWNCAFILICTRSDQILSATRHITFANLHNNLFLQLLRLHQSHIEDQQCRVLVKHLLDHPSLRELNFSHNLIGDKGARAIGKLLNRSKLEILNVSDNNITGPGAKAIANALSKNSTLLSLNLRLNRLRDEGGEAIGKALLSNNVLCHLHLGANEVTTPTAIALSKVLFQNSTLRSINLSCNNLGVVSFT